LAIKSEGSYSFQTAASGIRCHYITDCLLEFIYTWRDFGFINSAL